MNVRHLQRGDFESPAWRRLARFLQERVEEHRDRLEEPSLTDADTQAVRGQIAECRYLLALPEILAAQTQSPAQPADLPE